MERFMGIFKENSGGWNNLNIDIKRLIYAFFSIAISILVAYFGSKWIVGNKDAVGMIATIFSILAGFLIAVITIVADDRSLRGRNKHIRQYEVQNIKQRLFRHRAMFTTYLFVLLLALAATLKLPITDVWSARLDRVLLGFSVFAMLMSFRLPGQLTEEYIKRLEACVQPLDDGR
jgi:ABC-type Na+ efflux pump permease subunit